MLRYLLVLISLLPSVVFAQLTDSQLATQLITLIPNNTSNAITPSNVRKITQDGYDARISVYGNLGIKGLLGYNTLFTLTNDKQLVHKKYVDDKFAAIASSVLSWNGRTGTVLPLDGDYNFSQIGSKPNSISGYGIIPSFLDYASFYYPLTSNPSGFISLAQSRAGFNAPGPFFNYNSLTGVLGTTYTPLSNSLATGKVFIGNNSNIATEQTPSGEVAISSTGVFSFPNKNVTGTMGNSNVLFPTEFTIRNYVNSLGFYDGDSPVTTEFDPVFNSQGVKVGGIYADPTFISTLSKSKIIGLIDPVNADWNSSGGLSQILNKPIIPPGQVNADWSSVSGLSRILNKPTFAIVATTGNYADLSGKPTIPAAQINPDWNATSGLAQILNKPTIPSSQSPSDWTATTGVTRILNKPSFGAVAFSNSYTDLINKPSIPAGQINSDWTAGSGLSAILNKPDLTVYELISNKANDMTVINTVKYPNMSLFSNQLGLKQNSIPYTTENQANKNISPYVSNSSVKYVSDHTLRVQLDSLYSLPKTTISAVLPIRIGSGTGTCIAVDGSGEPLVDGSGVPLVVPCGGGAISIDTGTSISPGALSINDYRFIHQKADSLHDGYLSKTDFLYFYHKANAGAGGAITTETDPFYTSYGATKATTLTINGVTQDLSANRSWTIAGGVTSFNTRTGAITPATGDYTFAQIGSKPTTLSGYNITDAYPLTGNPSNFLTPSSIIPITQGGTNSTTAAGARTNLGLAIGTNVQAWDTDLDGLSGLSTTGFVKRTGAGTFTAGNLVASDIPSITKSKISDFPTNLSSFTNDPGYITGITNQDVFNHIKVKDPIIFDLSDAFADDGGAVFVTDAGDTLYSGDGTDALTLNTTGITERTYNYPQAIYFDKYGRATSVVEGSAPTGGTMSSISSGVLSGLFTTSISNPSTTPAISYSLNSQSANLFYMSPSSGSGSPLFRAPVTADFPDGLFSNSKLQNSTIGFSIGSTFVTVPTWSLSSAALGQSVSLSFPNVATSGATNATMSNSQYQALLTSISGAGSASSGSMYSIQLGNGSGGFTSDANLLYNTATSKMKIGGQVYSGFPGAGLTGNAWLNANAGTSTIAGLYLAPGSLLSSSANGHMENDGSHLYFTLGGSRVQLDNDAASGITSFTTFGSTPDSKGVTTSSGAATLQPADLTHPGGLSNGFQYLGSGSKALGKATPSTAVTSFATQQPSASLAFSAALFFGGSETAIGSTITQTANTTDNATELDFSVGSALKHFRMKNTGEFKSDGDINIGNHLISSSSAPSISGASGVMTATPTISGTDIGGTITFTTKSTTTSSGRVLTVTFNQVFATAPTVILTPANDNASAMRPDFNQVVFVPAPGETNGVTTSTFSLYVFNGNLPSSTTYKFNYLIVQ